MNDFSSILPLVQGPGAGYSDQGFLSGIQQQGAEKGTNLTNNILQSLKQQNVPLNKLDNHMGDYLGQEIGKGMEALPYLTGSKSPEVETFYDEHPGQAMFTDAVDKAPAAGVIGGGLMALNRMNEGASLRSGMSNIKKNFESTDPKTRVPRHDIDSKEDSLLSSIFGSARGKDGKGGGTSGEFDTYGKYTNRRYKHVLDELSKNPEYAERLNPKQPAPQGDSTFLGSERLGKFKQDKIDPFFKKRIDPMVDKLESYPAFKDMVGLGKPPEGKDAGGVKNFYDDYVRNLKSDRTNEAKAQPGAQGPVDYEKSLRDSGIGENVVAEGLNKTNAKLKGHADLYSALGHLGPRRPQNEEDYADLIRTSLPQYMGGSEQMDKGVMNDLLTQLEGGNRGRAERITTELERKIQAYKQPHGMFGPSEAWAHAGRKLKGPVAGGLGIAAGGMALSPVLKMLQQQIYGNDQHKEWLNNMRLSKGQFDQVQQ